MGDQLFWERADDLVRTSEIVIDRPRGSRHPRYPDIVYPLDYGYLAGTMSGDGEGIDIWVGSNVESGLTGVILTIDGFKRDTEVKLLIGCTSDEAELALAAHRTGLQQAMLITRQPHLSDEGVRA